MTTCIEYNDWQLRQFTTQGDVCYADIAAGSTASGALTFGQGAWSQARTNPQQFNARFLTSVNAEPIQGDMRPAQNQADLIYHQFQALQTTDADNLLAVPGYLTDEQLGLLLGISQQAGITINGFIDLSLVQALSESVTSPCVVLDVELHRLVLTELQADQNTLSVTRCRNLDGAGLINVLDGWMNLIADIFVHQTRFDPMHTGACEQQLLDQLTRWLLERKAGSRITIEHRDVLREVELEHHALVDKLEQRIEGLFRALDGSSPVLLTQRAQSLPGLTELLQRHGINCQLAKSDLPLTGVQQVLEEIPGDHVVRLTTAAVTQAAHRDNGADDMQTAPVAAVTHLLLNNTAYAVTDARFAGLDTAGLKPGQTITVAADTYVAIEVL